MLLIFQIFVFPRFLRITFISFVRVQLFSCSSHHSNHDDNITQITIEHRHTNMGTVTTLLQSLRITTTSSRVSSSSSVQGKHDLASTLLLCVTTTRHVSYQDLARGSLLRSELHQHTVLFCTSRKTVLECSRNATESSQSSRHCDDSRLEDYTSKVYCPGELSVVF